MVGRHRSMQILKQAAQNKLRKLLPKGSAHYKGPLDHLFVIRYACFVPAIAIAKQPTFYVEPLYL